MNETPLRASAADLQSASPYLSVAELAVLLHLNEKKVYQLAGDGVLPGSKITGKWLFPRTLVERWLIDNCHGGVLADRLLIAGSDDPLLHRLCSRLATDWQRSALLAYSPAGTRHGLRMLDAGRVDACFINWGAAEVDGRRHLALLRSYRNHADWTVVRCLERSQGFLLGERAAERHATTPRQTPVGGADAADSTTSPDAATGRLLRDRDLGWALRDDDSGSGRSLGDACAAHGVRRVDLNVVVDCTSERSAAAAVGAGEADVTPGVASVAGEYRLHYLPFADVAIDLVMSKRTYFRTLAQTLLQRLGDADAVREAAALGGYRLVDRQDVLSSL